MLQLFFLPSCLKTKIYQSDGWGGDVNWLELDPGLEVVLAEEGGEVADHPVVDPPVTLELGPQPLAVLVGGGAVRQGVVLETDGARAAVVGPSNDGKGSALAFVTLIN